MRTRFARPVTPAPAPEWDHRRLRRLVGAALVTGTVLLIGLVMAIVASVPSRHRHLGVTAAPRPAAAPLASKTSPAAVPSSAASASAAALAAAPMASLNLHAAQPGPVSTRNPGTIVVPASTRIGPAQVPTGYPHTPQGALAQLAALDQTAMQTATMAGVRAVISAWAAPGGPTPSSWSGVTAMAAFLTSAGLSGGGSPQLALVVTPLMGLIKGTVGPDLSLVCVDFEVDATFVATSRVADADCQTMLWRGDRWLIGPGPEPAAPPSVWPDTDAAIAAGYADLRRG